MPVALPRAREQHTPAHYRSAMPPERASDRRLQHPRALPALRHRRPGPLARFTAGPRLEDALRVATELVASGRQVALDHLAVRDADGVAELAALPRRLATAGLAASCELTVAVDRLGPADARVLASAAVGAGTGVCLTGAPGAVDALLPELPGVRAAVRVTEPGAERRCRFLAGRPVRLVAGRGAAADRTFARCLNVLLAAGGHLAAAAADPRLVAVVGERAAWYARPSDSWEHVMPYGVNTAEQQRLVASGVVVRVAVPSGPGSAGLLLRRLLGDVA